MRLKKMFTILLIIFGLMSNSRSNQSPQTGKLSDLEADSTAEITANDILNKMDSKDKCWMNLSNERYLEDFDYLYQELRGNYPFFGVAKRKYGIDLNERYIQTRKLLKTCDNDDAFFFAIQNYFIPREFIGHLDIWGTRYTSMFEGIKKFVSEYPIYKEKFAPYIEALENPITQKNYRGMTAFYDELYKKVEEANSEQNGKQAADAPETQPNDAVENISAKIIEAGKIAYVSIRSFDYDMASYDRDKEYLLDFYNKIADYDHLILDISENGGGGMEYFNDLIVSPNIDKTLNVPVYLLIKAGENNKKFLQPEQDIKSGEWKPVEELPVLPYMNSEDLKELDYFCAGMYEVEPLYESKVFKGKIWLLVSEMNYSSSEYAAMFSKHSGFATLVGCNTGGDGIGTDPVYIVLPNSGLVVQYSAIYGITADGTNSEEAGTKPDIISPEGESPLDTCLEEIRKTNHKYN